MVDNIVLYSIFSESLMDEDLCDIISWLLTGFVRGLAANSSSASDNAAAKRVLINLIKLKEQIFMNIWVEMADTAFKFNRLMY